MLQIGLEAQRKTVCLVKFEIQKSGPLRAVSESPEENENRVFKYIQHINILFLLGVVEGNVSRNLSWHVVMV